MTAAPEWPEWPEIGQNEHGAFSRYQGAVYGCTDADTAHAERSVREMVEHAIKNE